MSSFIDGPALIGALEAAEARLAERVDEVNRLNVYPVPDGDTGTNMLHTMRAAVNAARRADAGASAAMSAAAHGALMGARGNSGVILSQLFAGAKDAFAGHESAGGEELVAAFAKAKDLAYRAVVHPVEGTILTAISAMAEAVRGCEREDAGAVLDRAAAAGREATARTPELLPVLRHAGVVDAGAQGLVYVIEGIADLLNGRVGPVERVAAERSATREERAVSAAREGRSWGYDVQFLVPSPSRTYGEVREEMLRYGLQDPSLACVLVVGDESLLKVHVHTDQPHEILRIGLSAGALRDVVVENLDEMTAEHERETGIVVSREEVEVRPLAAVAVVWGPGLAAICRSLGVTPLSGGATAKPSVEELLRAIEAAPGEKVLLLSNDRDVLPAAQRAAEQAAKPVRVVPTSTLGQGMAALVAFDPQGNLDAVGEAMEASMAATRTLEVTCAARDATVDDVNVRAGQHIALVDRRCVGAGASAEEAVAVGARSLERAELCTVYVGEGIDQARVRDAATRLREALGCEVEVVQGGQPHYPYVVSVE